MEGAEVRSMKKLDKDISPKYRGKILLGSTSGEICSFAPKEMKYGEKVHFDEEKNCWTSLGDKSTVFKDLKYLDEYMNDSVLNTKFLLTKEIRNYLGDSIKKGDIRFNEEGLRKIKKLLKRKIEQIRVEMNGSRK